MGLLGDWVCEEAVKEPAPKLARLKGDPPDISGLLNLGNFEEPPTSKAQTPQKYAHRQAGNESGSLKKKNKLVLKGKSKQ